VRVELEFELGKRCGVLFEVITTREERRETLRPLCLERDPVIAMSGPRNKPLTYAEAFAWIYGEAP
jgi:hypothetical protein